MRDKDAATLAKIYQTILENHAQHSGDKPCPCEKKDGVCTKQGCECDVCEKAMEDKEDKK